MAVSRLTVHEPPRIGRRDFLAATALGALGVPLRAGQLTAAAPGETLYNGIALASPWPPDNRHLSPDPITPPYLADPPAVIPIDVGRQLFVDDFLIEETAISGFPKEHKYPISLYFTG